MKISDTTPTFSLISAVFIFGGYPQRPWDEAVRELERLIKTETRAKVICPTTLWILGRKKFGKDYKFI